MSKGKKIRDLTPDEREIAAPLAVEYQRSIAARSRALDGYHEAVKKLVKAGGVIGEDFEKYSSVLRPFVRECMKHETVMQHHDGRLLEARNRMGDLAMAISGDETGAVELDLDDMALREGGGA